jgi:hypothetical protein
MIHKRQALLFISALALCLLIALVINRRTASAQQNPEEVARQELPGVLQRIADIGSEKYGFTDTSELSSVTLGQPYEVYSLEPQAIQQHRSGTKIVDLLRQENAWIFPVLVNGSAKTLLTVGLQNGEWHIVSFGGQALAQRLALYQSQASVEHIKLVKVYNVYGTFALSADQQGETLALLQSYPGLFEGIGVSALTSFTPDELLPYVAKAIELSPAQDVGAAP